MTTFRFIMRSASCQNLMLMRILTKLGMNTKWKVTSVDVQYPRLILTLGGVYNGE